MLDDRNLYRGDRNLDGLGYPAPPGLRDDGGYVVPGAILLALLLIGGYFLATTNSDGVRTASNESPAISRQAPTPAAPPPSTAPKE